jgi:hypothetical protein
LPGDENTHFSVPKLFPQQATHQPDAFDSLHKVAMTTEHHNVPPDVATHLSIILEMATNPQGARSRASQEVPCIASGELFGDVLDRR